MTTSGAALTDASEATAAIERAEWQPAPRLLRFAASADDFGRLLLGSLGALVIAFAYLFWRTSWGAVDASDGDSAAATALLLAAAPTWLAWMLASALTDGATPGQMRRGLTVRLEGRESIGARLLRFGVHPLSAPGWLWLAAISYLLEAPLLTWLLLLCTVSVTLVGTGSAILVAVGRRAFHELLVRAEVEVQR